MKNMISLKTIQFAGRCTAIFAIAFLSGIYCLQAKTLKAYLSYSTFYSPTEGPYIETYLSIAGSTVHYIADQNNQFIGQVQVILIFRSGDEIVNFDKYTLQSPPAEDTINNNFNFLDQQRYKLPNGKYTFEIQISDMNSGNKPYIHTEMFEMDYSSANVAISGIQYIESAVPVQSAGPLTKNGYDIVTYVSDFFPENSNKLTFYAEIYNTDKALGPDEKFLLSYFIQNMDLNKPVNEYVRYKKESAAPVSVVFSEFDITGLKSGNYFLIIETRNKENILLSSCKRFFQRSNPRMQIKPEDLEKMDIAGTFAGRITGIDTLHQFVAFLEPISSEHEKYFAATLMKSNDKEVMQRYFYKFWYDRDEDKPELAWLHYLNEVNKVNLAYSTQISKGFESDRGRVYLKYGPPNAISESYNEPATYPYEIWHYYTLKDGQRNKKFVFYTKDIVTNDFVQIHSDVSGELSNYRWQQAIYSRVDAGFNIDEGVSDDTWGGNSKKYFDIPR
ncbi:MAG: GWxTD domain-containing protein [Bacteroidales bacterium]|nr:GWxTD domain-containing protein [Bacteroidales bacterium]